MESSYLDSKSDEFETPDDLYDALNQEFLFVLDAAASDENSKCEAYYTKEHDALNQNWYEDTLFPGSITGAIWCNPPYSRGNLHKFTAKAYEEAQKGATVVMLVPACTDTSWFHDNVLGKAEIRFVQGRVSFIGGKGPARFPSLILIYRGKSKPGQQLQ